ncbi:MAG: phage tail protein, partial [Desulfovibrio sp.]|nr:phage tail protein [Desulfovibrio sp.]
MKTVYRFVLPLLLALAVTSSVTFAAVDSTSFNPLPIAVEAKGSGGVPVGTVIAWPVVQNPDGFENWLECNGQSFSPAVYPELSAVLGGASAVPDLRGQFLRGVGGKSAAIGVKQTDATYIREGEAKQTLFGVKETMMAS